MGGYFLKTHYKSVGAYPEKAVHFPEDSGQLAQDFAQGDAFLLYETKKGDRPGLEGAGCIWGMGRPLGRVIPIPPQQVNGRQFTMAVPVKVLRSVRDRRNGVPGARVQEVLGRPLGFVGGVWKLTPEQFTLLLGELGNCISREERLGFDLKQWKGTWEPGPER